MLRGYLAFQKYLRLKEEKEKNELEASAIKIQSVFRGKKTRHQVQQNIQEKSILLIQRYSRSYLSNKITQSLRKAKENRELEQSVVKIQSVFRGKKTREQLTQNMNNDQQDIPDKTQIKLPKSVLNSVPI